MEPQFQHDIIPRATVESIVKSRDMALEECIKAHLSLESANRAIGMLKNPSQMLRRIKSAVILLVHINHGRIFFLRLILHRLMNFPILPDG